MLKLCTLKVAAMMLLVGASFLSSQTLAQTARTASEEYGDIIKGVQTLTALGPDLFGEAVNLKDGATSFSATDVSIPTNSGLPLSIGRHLGINARDADGYTNTAVDGELFGNWKLEAGYTCHVGHVRRTHRLGMGKRCKPATIALQQRVRSTCGQERVHAMEHLLLFRRLLARNHSPHSWQRILSIARAAQRPHAACRWQNLSLDDQR